MSSFNYTHIISAADLQALILHRRPGQLALFDTRFSLADAEAGRRAYQQSHLPGAIYLHLDEHLSGPIAAGTGRHPLPSIDRFAALMRQQGVSTDTQVVAYDDAGGMFASRLWWMLKWLGHDRVAVLDGGFPAWQRMGGRLDAAIPALPPSGSFSPVPRHEMLMTAQQVQQGVESGSLLLCDARAPERYRGDVEPIDKVAGHVPGAINLPFSQNLNAEGCFQSPGALRLRLVSIQSNSVGTERPIVHMCGSGVTACHNLLAAAVAGLPIPRLYAGSWSEWITDPSRPTAQGAQP